MKLPNFEFKNQTDRPLEGPEKARQLQESFNKKLGVVIDLRTAIGNPETSSLPAEDFANWTQKRKEQLERDFPEAKKGLEKLQQKGAELKLLKIQEKELYKQEEVVKERAFLAYKEANPESPEEDPEEVDFFTLWKYYSEDDNRQLSRIQEESSVLGQKVELMEWENRKLLHHAENPFLYTSLHFLDKISQKKKQVEDLEHAHEAGQSEFTDALRRLERETQTSTHDIRQYISGSFSELQIEFTPYEIVVWITKEDAEKYFQTSYRGWHSSNTPFCFVVKAENTEQQSYTKTHEIGHNRLECAEVGGIHNTVYIEASLPLLQERIRRLRNLKLLKTLPVVLEREESLVKDRIKNQLLYLNGEIAADVENIAKGNLSAFYFHFTRTASILEKLIKTRRGGVKDEVTKLVQEEIGKLEVKTAEHLKEVLFFSYLSRKYEKQEEFCALLTMDPDSPRLLRRYFSEELGDDFTYEKFIFELIPETTLPEVIHQRVYDIEEQVGGTFAEMFLKPGEQHMRMIPPNNPLPPEHDWQKWKHYSDFEHTFARKYSGTKLLSPFVLTSFLEIAEKRSLGDVDQRAIAKIKDLLEDFYGNFRFSSIFDSEQFSPCDDSAESWTHSIENIRKYERQLVELCGDIGESATGKVISKYIYDTTVYKALQSAVLSDNPEPLKQVFEKWEMAADKGDFFSKTGKFLGGYDVADWFEDGDETLANKYLQNPEQTKVYQYLLSVLQG